MARFTLDFNIVLKDFEDKPLRSGGSPDIIEAINTVTGSLTADVQKQIGEKLDLVFGKELTLVAVSMASLQGAYDDEKNLGEQERMRRFELSRRIFKTAKKGEPVEFNNEERELIKTLSRKRYLGALVSPMISEMLEDAVKVKDKDAEEKAVAT